MQISKKIILEWLSHCVAIEFGLTDAKIAIKFQKVISLKTGLLIRSIYAMLFFILYMTKYSLSVEYNNSKSIWIFQFIRALTATQNRFWKIWVLVYIFIETILCKSHHVISNFSVGDSFIWWSMNFEYANQQSCVSAFHLFMCAAVNLMPIVQAHIHTSIYEKTFNFKRAIETSN